MAGPGGGPPRRSHTKSRKGCETCKRRHIRCDENFPQCRNCTKHKIRCPYNDAPLPDDRSTTPDKPDLMWTPEIEATINQWKQTGLFPFPSLNIVPAPNPANHSVDDLRLIHHLASICEQLTAINANDFTLWTRQIPTIIKIAAENDYVMQSLLAFSAMHIAHLTDCPLVGNLAFVHRGNALKGLQEAINSFSPETSDAVLAASLVLSWQATDWRSWTQLMQGTSSVIDAMDAWKDQSQFGDFIAESSTFPTAPPSPIPDHKPSQPRKEDIDAFLRAQQQVQRVETYLKQGKKDTKLVQQLLTFMKGARKLGPSRSVEEQFDRLRDLRTWLFWLPIRLLEQTEGSSDALVITAHYYAVALLVERLFPEVGAAYFGSLSIHPIEEIARRLMTLNHSPQGRQGETPLALMEFPISTVNEFRSRMGWVQPARTPSFPRFNPPNFYVNETVPLPPVTDGYSIYGENPAFSYSTESLPMLNAEAAPGSAISPLTLSSPFTSQQYLNIPSPSYGGYSPASSTFEGSIAFSDTEEYGIFDVHGLSDAGPSMVGDPNRNFGVGFVSPIQTVWI